VGYRQYSCKETRKGWDGLKKIILYYEGKGGKRPKRSKKKVVCNVGISLCTRQPLDYFSGWKGGGNCPVGRGLWLRIWGNGRVLSTKKGFRQQRKYMGGKDSNYGKIREKDLTKKKKRKTRGPTLVIETGNSRNLTRNSGYTLVPEGRAVATGKNVEHAHKKEKEKVSGDMKVRVLEGKKNGGGG